MIDLPLLAAVTRGQALLWTGILLGCLIVGSSAIYMVRRYLRGPRDASSGPGLTMSQVREMRQRGEISEQEYKALRRIVASQSK